MEYSKIVAVTGLPGLYELISSKGDGAIVRSLDDKTTRFASSRVHNFSHLESIEVFTTGNNVNLVEIFQAMEKSGGSLPDAKDNAAIKKYFEKVYPEMDFERVYNSDLKKMVKWFESLHSNSIELKLTEPEEEVVEEEEEEVKEEKPKKEKKAPAAEAPAKAPKKAAKKKEEEEEKPKKAAAKKSAPAKKKK